jgi:hypothetical protein
MAREPNLFPRELYCSIFKIGYTLPKTGGAVGWKEIGRNLENG